MVFGVHVIPEIGAQRQDGDARRPAFVRLVGSVEQSVLDDFLWCGAGFTQRRHRLGDEEGRTVLQALLEGALAAVDEALAANPDVVEKIRGGKVQAAGAIVGAVMKATKGQADAARVRELVMAACS